MTVTFYRQRPDGPEKIGIITLHDGQLIADPADTIALNSLLAEPLKVYHEDGPTFIDPTTHPEAFLRALPAEYRGSYFWCGKVENE